MTTDQPAVTLDTSITILQILKRGASYADGNLLNKAIEIIDNYIKSSQEPVVDNDLCWLNPAPHAAPAIAPTHSAIVQVGLSSAPPPVTLQVPDAYLSRYYLPHDKCWVTVATLELDRAEMKCGGDEKPVPLFRNPLLNSHVREAIEGVFTCGWNIDQFRNSACSYLDVLRHWLDTSPTPPAASPAGYDAAQCLRELSDLWPNWRQLVDGFTQDADWNNEWDQQTRQSMIDWGLKWLPLVKGGGYEQIR
jgi:hypothetical protein